MRKRYSFSSRRTGKLQNIRKQRAKYPALLQKVVETSDIILEILDARFPEETRNKEIEELIKKQGKILIYVLNKSDLTKERKTNLKPSIFISATKRQGGRALRDKIKLEAKKVKKSEDNNYDRIQVGVVGYPNTGKSSIINVLIGKTSAKTGSEAGFTKGLQKLRLSSEILLLDSPGVIPESEYSTTSNAAIAKHTKVGGRDPNKVKDPEIVINEFFKDYKSDLEKFYKIKSKDSEDFLEQLGKQKNFFKQKGEIDQDRTARLILRDWQAGKIKL